MTRVVQQLFHKQAHPCLLVLTCFVSLQGRDINFVPWMNMLKDHVSSIHFSRAYTSQVLWLWRRKLYDQQTLQLLLFEYSFREFSLIHILLYKWESFRIYSDEFFSMKTKLVMKNAALYLFCTH